MNCANANKQWIVYDAKNQVFIELSHEEFKNFLLDRPVKLKDIKIWNREKGKKVWIDGIVNSEYFK